MPEDTTPQPVPIRPPLIDELKYVANTMRRELALMKCSLLNTLIVEGDLPLDESQKNIADQWRQSLTAEYQMCERAVQAIERIIQERVTGT